MSLAAHSTTAKSAPPRTGGQAQQPATHTGVDSRRSDLHGGDMNRRGEAESIIRPLPASTEGAYTPTAGVRRAAILLPRCAQPVRLPAQLAKGYKPTLTLIAVLLAGVTATSVGITISSLIPSPALAVLFGGAAVVLDLFKLLAWPLGLVLLTDGRRWLAVLVFGVAASLTLLSTWATTERIASALQGQQAQQQAVTHQRISDLTASQQADRQQLASLDAERLSVLQQAAALRDRGMATRASELEQQRLPAIAQQQDQARQRLDTTSRELTTLHSQPAPSALPQGIALTACTGFAAALEIVPALILAALLHPHPAAPLQPLPSPTSSPLAARPETSPETLETAQDATSPELTQLLRDIASTTPGTPFPVRPWARKRQLNNHHASELFRTATQRGALRKEQRGYVVAGGAA